MLRRINIEKDKQKKLYELKKTLLEHNAYLLNFEILYKTFGDIIITIKFENKIHNFTTDRGDIYYNGRPIRNNSYHVTGEDDTFCTLVEIITKELF